MECIAIHIINTKTFREEKKPEKRKLEFSKRAGSDQCVFILCFLNGNNRCVTSGGMAMEGKDHFILFLTTPTYSKTLKQLIIVKSSPLHQVSVEVRSGTRSPCWGSVRYTKSVLRFGPVHQANVEVRSVTRRPFWALVLCTKSVLRFGPDASHHHFHRLNNCAVTCFTTCYVLFDHLNDQKVPLTSSWGIIKSYYRKLP